MSSIEKAESEDLGEESSITLAEVIMVAKKLPGSKALKMDEIYSDMLKTLDIVGLG